MPRYFFDTEDSRLAFRDQEGVEFDDRARAQAAATIAVGDILRTYLPNMGSAESQFVMKVRDREGPVCEITVSYSMRTYD